MASHDIEASIVYLSRPDMKEDARRSFRYIRTTCQYCGTNIKTHCDRCGVPHEKYVTLYECGNCGAEKTMLCIKCKLPYTMECIYT